MDANTTRHPSRVVSALLRLERAGDEHSRTTARLCDAAWLVADLLRQRMDALPDPDAMCQVRAGLNVDRHAVTVWLRDENGNNPWAELVAENGDARPPSRRAAHVIARAIASGLIDDIATWLEDRASRDITATATLDAAAERLPSDEARQDTGTGDCACGSCVRERRTCDICGAPGADIVRVDGTSYLGETHPQGAGAYWLLCDKHQPGRQSGERPTQDELRALWNAQSSSIARILDDDGDNVGGALTRLAADGRWLYVDDMDGYVVLEDDEVRRMLANSEPAQEE
mgnify:FL=1